MSLRGEALFQALMGPPLDWLTENGDPRAAAIRALVTGEDLHRVAEYLLRLSNQKVRDDRAAAKSGAHRTNGGYLHGVSPLRHLATYERARQLAETAALASAERWMHRPDSERSRELGQIIAEANYRATELDMASSCYTCSITPTEGWSFWSSDYTEPAPLDVLDVDAILGDTR